MRLWTQPASPDEPPPAGPASGLCKQTPIRSLGSLVRAFVTLSVMTAVEPVGAALPEPADRRPRFERLSGDQGLSHAVVYALAEDGAGFLWFGTQDGLNRHDGASFSVFRHVPLVPTSLPKDDISYLLPSGNRGLWVGTWGGGLSLLHLETEEFSQYPHDPADPKSLPDGRVQYLFEDSRGTLWVGTFSGGLSRLDSKSRSFTTYLFDTSTTTKPNNRVWGICEDPDGSLWIATERGLARFDPASETFEHYRHDAAEPRSLSHDGVRAVHVDTAGTLWVGTQEGLNRFDRRTRSFERFLSVPGVPTTLGDNVITVLYEDKHGGFWIGTSGRGLNRLDRASGRFTRFPNDPNDLTSLSSNDVRGLIEDRSGVLWIATRGGGISKLDLTPPTFSLVAPRADDPRSLSNAAVTALVVDREDRLWVGTPEGLDRYDGLAKGFTKFKHDPLDPSSVPRGGVQTLLVDKSGTLWAGKGRGGLSRFVSDDQGFHHYRHDPGDPTSLINDLVTEVFEDSSGDFWVGTSDGLDRFDRRRQVFEHFRNSPQDAKSLSDNIVWSIAEDSRGNLWVGTDMGGANRFNRATRTFEHFRNDPLDPRSLSNNRVQTIYQHPGGSLWLGTADGLNEFLPASSGFRRSLEGNGGSHFHLFDILGDGLGRLWLSTGSGLARFDPKSGELRTYSVRDGLQGMHFIPGACMKDRSGRMYFGGPNGFNYFRPESVLDYSFVPPVVLTGFKKFNKPVKLPGAPFAVKDIQLSYKDNFFTFEFAALDYASPFACRYRYRLEGLDRDWVDAGTSRSATYTNVDPGKYVFRVMGSSSGQVWNTAGTSVRITITPPVWKTLWFRFLAGLTVLAAAAAAYQTRIRGLRNRERDLSRRVHDALVHLRKSEERYRVLFERNLAGVVQITTEGRLVDCNDATARLFGFDSREELRRHGFLALWDTPEKREALLGKLKAEGMVVSDEFRVRGKDGNSISLLGNANLIVGNEGGQAIIEATLLDVSERRRMEEKLHKAQKLESLGVLAGGIAHDFNNLLMAVLGNAELALLSLEATSLPAQRIQRIVQAGQRAADLAKQMLAYSGRGVILIKPMSLSELIREMAPLLEIPVSTRATVRYCLDHDLPAIKGDPTGLGQVVMNLVTNAAEAFEKQSDGTISITTGVAYCTRDDLKAAFLDENLEPGSYVLLEVADNGCGMDKDTQTRVFDPFFTTKFAGRGLGLAAVLGIVRAHRGAIRMDSEPGRGTTFRVFFPAAPGIAVRTTRGDVSATSWRGSGTVLLVDDDPSVRTVATEILELLGFKVLVAEDGRQAVEVFRERRKEIELVILDLTMPRMNGEEVFRELRAIDTDARVILSSGFGEEEATRCLAGKGLCGFIQKPYVVSALREQLRSVLEG